MIHCQEQGQWPKWLKRKSYFNECRLFHLYYREADQDIPVPDSHVKKKAEPPAEQAPSGRKKKGARRKGRPAFSSGRKGGVFGFKR